MFKRKNSSTAKTNRDTPVQIKDLLANAGESSDFSSISPFEDKKISLHYYSTLIDEKKLYELVLQNLQDKIKNIQVISDIVNIIPVDGVKITEDPKEVEEKLHKGYAILLFKNDIRHCALINIENWSQGVRKTNDTNSEYSVVGPKLGFIEDIKANMHLLRRELLTSDLVFEEIKVGTKLKTNTSIVYMKGITNPEYIHTVRQRLKDVDFDGRVDSTVIEQLISDNNYTPFPLFIVTERVDRAVSSLLNGQLVILTEGSCYAIIGPSTLMDFFSAAEDYYLSWIQGTFFRLIRFFGVGFSILATPMYVAILTYHYEVIPSDLLGPIIFSRANVPFPPFLEVLFLEITIELLREAGARLPNKIGQTLGIVGGIVIGQATVEAALTSNILLIIVALAALSSFTTPIYKMSNTVRLLRFPLIFLAAIWGGYGLAVAIVLLLGHLMKLKSIGNPYMVPLFPFRVNDIGSGLSRLPYSLSSKRPGLFRPLQKKRYKVSENNDPQKDLDTE
ncbi:spore gernimation protein GerA [Bacillus sp. FJAT-18017]|uniref:spore germination protein n=1 Tax=Bacillus sp. FJAT-18017 TaxID=1705566 RepID=UPI0006AED45B|nr:spore germination protein [Bacillus sp. FJAT-18017]ALC92166.1 spore gernimation protein GerA [Bacillus sp. FJAT-18017]